MINKEWALIERVWMESDSRPYADMKKAIEVILSKQESEHRAVMEKVKKLLYLANSSNEVCKAIDIINTNLAKE